jgi:hypothetical protein
MFIGKSGEKSADFFKKFLGRVQGKNIFFSATLSREKKTIGEFGQEKIMVSFYSFL